MKIGVVVLIVLSAWCLLAIVVALAVGATVKTGDGGALVRAADPAIGRREVAS